MTKIALLVNSLSVGGGERSVIRLAQGLIDRNTDIEVLCLENHVFYNISPSLRIAFLSRMRGRENSFVKFFFLLIFAIRLKKYCRRNDIGIICSNLYRANFVNCLSKYLGSKHKVCIVNRGMISRYKEEGLLGKINLRLIKGLYPLADIIICISRAMQEDMQRLFRFKTKSVVISNLYNLDQIEENSDEAITSDEFLFDGEKKYLISLGRLISLKRNRDIINAFSKVCGNYGEIELIFLGDGEDKQNLAQLCRDIGISERVHFPGDVKNPFKFLRRAFLFISASETEGFPNVLVEALACSCPVIFSDCLSGPREILAPASNPLEVLRKGMELTDFGILVAVGDVLSFSAAMELLLTNKDVYNHLKNSGLLRAKDFSADIVIKKYEEIFHAF